MIERREDRLTMEALDEVIRALDRLTITNAIRHEHRVAETRLSRLIERDHYYREKRNATSNLY